MASIGTTPLGSLCENIRALGCHRLEADPDRIDAKDRSFIESNTSNWMSADDDASLKDHHLQPNANEQVTGVKQSLISIRALLGTMIGSAVLMLGLKLFPYDSSGVRVKSAMGFVPLAIWLAWVAIEIATLIWLQLGSIFSPQRGRFILCFFALAIFGPIVFHLIGAWLLAWNPETRFTIEFEQFVIVYSIEADLVAGVALVLPLLPRRAVD